jgi:hypothetical protein
VSKGERLTAPSSVSYFCTISGKKVEPTSQYNPPKMELPKVMWTKAIKERYGDSRASTFKLLWNQTWLDFQDEGVRNCLEIQLSNFVNIWKVEQNKTEKDRDLLSSFLNSLHEMEKISLDLFTSFLIEYDAC